MSTEQKERVEHTAFQIYSQTFGFLFLAYNGEVTEEIMTSVVPLCVLAAKAWDNAVKDPSFLDPYTT